MMQYAEKGLEAIAKKACQVPEALVLVSHDPPAGKPTTRLA